MKEFCSNFRVTVIIHYNCVQPEYPGLGDFLPTMPSLLPGGTTAAIPTLTPAMLWSDLYAFCFTFFYGARKCCIGIIFPPVGIKCEPNEKKRNEI